MAKKGSILLNLVNLSAKKIQDILKYFKDTDELLEVDRFTLASVKSLKSEDINRILTCKESKVLDKELELIRKEGINCLDIFDKDYPYLLREIDNPPLVLYIKGDKNVLNKSSVAIVGSRKSTNYGNNMATEFSSKLSACGLVITSGLAKGIDTAAHKAAIKKGESIAVLGSGLLNIYPGENKSLARAIAKRGAVISEFPLMTKPLRENFPRRNRIVSGLSLGVLVVEAALRSGALITARIACEQNREVFAVPGNINSCFSEGTNHIIKEGAKPVTCLEDILEELNLGVKV